MVGQLVDVHAPGKVTTCSRASGCLAVCEGRVFPMSIEMAKTLLEQAKTPLQREQAVQAAFRLGMPLHKIEEYLDWLDAVRAGKTPTRSDHGDNEDRREKQA